MIPLIIDTDPGCDDAMAIAYALAHPELNLVGLTTVFGNTTVAKTTRNARWLLERFGAREVAVAQGAAVPLVQQPLPTAEFVHGDDGIGNTYDADESLSPVARHSRELDTDAADFIIDTARRSPGTLRLVAIGPLTNIAEALRREPELPALVHSLVIMGGTVDEPGNVTPLAEANFYNDPHAADEVLSRDWPVCLIGLDVTHRIMIKDSDLDRLGAEAGRTGELIRASSRFYVDFYTRQGAARDAHAGGAQPACAMHDAAAVIYLVAPDAFVTVTGGARVVPEGMAAGQLALDRTGYRYARNDWDDREPVSACMSVDAPRVLADFIDTLVAGHLS